MFPSHDQGGYNYNSSYLSPNICEIIRKDVAEARIHIEGGQIDVLLQFWRANNYYFNARAKQLHEEITSDIYNQSLNELRSLLNPDLISIKSENEDVLRAVLESFKASWLWKFTHYHLLHEMLIDPNAVIVMYPYLKNEEKMNTFKIVNFENIIFADEKEGVLVYTKEGYYCVLTKEFTFKCENLEKLKKVKSIEDIESLEYFFIYDEPIESNPFHILGGNLSSEYVRNGKSFNFEERQYFYKSYFFGSFAYANIAIKTLADYFAEYLRNNIITLMQQRPCQECDGEGKVQFHHANRS